MRQDISSSPSGFPRTALPDGVARELDADIVIVGGGAIGKTAALALDSLGLRIVLVSPPANQDPAREGWDARVYALNSQARSLLRATRVWDALDASRMTAVDAMLIEGDAADRPGRLCFDAYSARTEALAWIVEDSNLNQALDAALRFARGVRRLPAKATALDVRADRASLTFDNGASMSASLVIGADGGQSWVRTQSGIDIQLKSYHQHGVVTNFACERPHHGAAYQRFTADEGIVALLPLPHRQVSLVWSAPDRLAAELMAMPFDGLAERAGLATRLRFGRLTPLHPAERKAFPLTLMRAVPPTASRVALIGDAAHVVHPLAGQGMNLGFADVAALVAAMAAREAHRDCGDDRVLGRYVRARKEEVLLMQGATDGLARLFGETSGPLALLRNAGLNWVDRLPMLKRRLIEQALGRS